MNKFGFLFFGLLLFIIAGITEASSQKRLALVIGNSNYKTDYLLTNPVNDAANFAVVLRKLNFEVIEKKNLTKAQMKLAIKKFKKNFFLSSFV